MPAVIERARRRSGGQPQRTQTDDEAGEIHEQVRSVRHHRQTSSEIPPWTQTRHMHLLHHIRIKVTLEKVEYFSNST